MSKILLFAALTLGPQQVGAAAGGQILGIVKGSDGTALVGATVLLRRTIPAGAPSRNATQWTASSTAGGAFQFDLLPAGQYTLCAKDSSGGWLNPCEWGGTPTVVNLASTKAPASSTVVMLAGVVVPIRVSDPSHILAQSEGSTPGAHLLLGVRSPALIFHAAQVIEQDSTGRTYGITIPFGTQLNVVIASALFQIANASGVAVPSGSTIPISVQSAQNPPIISLTVTGIRQTAVIP